MKTKLRILYGENPETASEKVLEDYFHEVGTFSPDVHYINAAHGDGEMRTFRVDRIWSACNAETGESIEPWLIDNPNGTKPLTMVSRPYAPAICTMHEFVAKTRGFRKRERDRFDQFTLELINDSSGIDTAMLCEHAFRLGRSESGSEIPTDQTSVCRRHALIIAAGSGRRPIDTAVMQQIEALFPAQSLTARRSP